MKKLSATITAAGFFVIFICFAPPAHAATSTVMGLGYWQGNGYVSFNCANDEIGDQLDFSWNFCGNQNATSPICANAPDNVFHFYAPPCKYNQHGVYIDSNNNFFGQAWNDKRGFISFSGTSTPPDNYNATNASGHCAHICNDSNNCWSCYNEAQQKVYGWARVDSVDSSGEWIRLDSSVSSPPIPVKIQTSCSIPPPAPGIGQGDFYGYATSSSNSLLSFNCLSDNILGTCASRKNYKVYISNLTVGSLSAPNWTYSDACTNALGADLKWCVKSGTQAAYEIVIDTNPYGATPTIDANTFCHYMASSPYAADFYPQNNCPPMGYNQNYYWWIRLYDQNASSTDWYQYYGNSTGDTDGDADRFTNPTNHQKTFTTYKNKFPVPYSSWSPGQPGFQWSPDAPQVGSTTKFTSDPHYYTSYSPSTPQLCDDANCIYRWWSDTPGTTIASSSFANTDIVFSRPTSTDVSLTVTVDNPDKYSCTWKQIISNITYGLPVWREIKAQ
jgi:hypothetical protein